MPSEDYLILEEGAEEEEDHPHCWNVKEHLHEIVDWVRDHIGIKEVALLLAAAGLVVLALTHLDFCVMLWNSCMNIVKEMGALAMVPIAVFCIIATVIGVPVDFFLVWSGASFEAMYGPFLGTILAIAACSVGVYVGCLAAFMLGRTVFRPKVEKYMNQYPMLQVVNAIIESDGWKFAFVMRLSPLMPNEPLNYACAMTSMSLKHMAISTIGSLPKTAYEVWLAAQAANALASKSSDSTLSVPFLIISNSVLLLLMVALCLQGYYKYHHFVQNTKAITKSQKNTMRRRSTLRGFNAESDRRLKLNADPQRRASSWHSQIDKNALKTVDGKSERKVSSCIFPVTGEVSGA